MRVSAKQLEERHGKGCLPGIKAVAEALSIPLDVVMDNKEVDKPCPRCNCFMVLVAEHAFMELWECPQCGYLERVKQ